MGGLLFYYTLGSDPALWPAGESIFQSKDEPEVGFELRKADRWCEELLSETVAMVEWGGGLGGGGS